MVGRASELGALERALADLNRRSGFVLLAGDPGTGKTRLLAELGNRARDRFAVSSARASDLGNPVRFQLFIEALGDQLGADPGSLRAAGTHAELASVFAGTPGEDRLDQQGNRFAVFSALRCWLSQPRQPGRIRAAPRRRPVGRSRLRRIP